MQNVKEKIGIIAAKTARDALLEAYNARGIGEASIAEAIRDALQAKRQVEVLTPKGWDVSPGVPDHKTRLKAAQLLADTLDVKAPTRVDISGGGLLGSAAVFLIEEVLREQGIAVDVAPQGQLSHRTALLSPSRFDFGDGF